MYQNIPGRKGPASLLVEKKAGSPPMSPKAPTLLLLDHSREGLEKLVRGLELQGYQTVLCKSVPESQALAQENLKPDLVVFAPLVLDPRGVEAEILSRFMGKGPTPVLLVVDHLDKLEKASLLPLPLRDFVIPPLDPKEVAHRIEAGLRIRKEILALKKAQEELSRQVIRDFKTGLYNARHFAQELQREFQRVHRTSRPLALLFLDIDDFKKINDTTDYAFGDKVLVEFARLLKANIREVDVAARFGGDEFLVLLPGTTPAEAIQVASRIRNVVTRMEVSDGRFSRRITVSIGVDCYNGKSASSPQEIRSRANRALQEAKRRGKNCIWLFADTQGERRNPRVAGSGGAPEI